MTNNKKEKRRSSGGSGMLSTMQSILIVMKITGKIDWSWVKVFMPTIISVGIVGIVLIGYCLYLCFGKNPKHRYH